MLNYKIWQLSVKPTKFHGVSLKIRHEIRCFMEFSVTDASIMKPLRFNIIT